MKPIFKDALICLHCQAPLEWRNGGTICTQCRAEYPGQGQCLNFVADVASLTVNPERSLLHSGISRHLGFLRKPFFQKLFAPVMFFKNPRGKVALYDLIRDSQKVLNVGSGETDYGKQVLNMDVVPGKSVDIIADASRLPFPDNYFDALICMDVLEHVADSQKALGELDRVLAPGGRIFITIPFIQRFHPSPQDFRRYTLSGLKHLRRGWTAVETGTWMGPACAFQEMLTNFCAIMFSFGRPGLNNAFLVMFRYLFYPLQLLDYLLCRYPSAILMAMDFYGSFIKKPEAQAAR